VEGKPKARWIQSNSPQEGYQSPPFELTPRTWRKTLLGTESQIEKILSRFEKAGLHFRIASAGEAAFTPDSLVMSLTDSQRKTLIEAYNEGYFDLPRKIGSEKLAKSLSLSKSTVSEHLRRAEKILLNQILA
jgi:predicted DNA binding protein